MYCCVEFSNAVIDGFFREGEEIKGWVIWGADDGGCEIVGYEELPLRFCPFCGKKLEVPGTDRYSG